MTFYIPYPGHRRCQCRGDNFGSQLKKEGLPLGPAPTLVVSPIAGNSIFAGVHYAHEGEFLVESNVLIPRGVFVVSCKGVNDGPR